MSIPAIGKISLLCSQLCFEEQTEGCIEIDLFSLAQKLQSELHSIISDTLIPLSLDSVSDYEEERESESYCYCSDYLNRIATLSVIPCIDLLIKSIFFVSLFLKMKFRI